MVGNLLSAFAAGLTTIVFLVGFSSVRLRSQRDRAIAQSDSLTADLISAERDGRLVTDRDIQRTANAFSDATRLDPIGRWTVGFTWLVFALMVCLLMAAVVIFGPAVNLLELTMGKVAIAFVMVVAFATATVGTAEYQWVGRDLRARAARSLIGQVRKAIELRASGDFHAALHAANDIAKAVESWPWVYAFRSQLHEALGSRTRAVADIERALALDPASVWNRVARAELRMKEDDATGALDDLRSLGDRLPVEPTILRLLGSALNASGARAEAIQAFDRALALDPNDSDTRLSRGRVLSGGDDSTGHHELPDLLRTIVLDEGQRIAVEAVANTARRRLHENDLDTAIEDFSLVLQHDPDNVEALVYRGLARSRRGQVDESTADFECALSHAVRLPWVLETWGIAVRGRRELDAADELFSRSISAGGSRRNYMLRGLLRETRGKLDEARGDFESALAIEPNNRDVKAHCARVLGLLGSAERSEIEFRELTEKDPSDVHAFELWIRTLLQLKNADEALVISESALRENPFEARLYELRSRVYFALKRFGSALSDIESAEALGGEAALLALDRAACLAASGDMEAALAALSVVADAPSDYQFAALANRATLRREGGDVEGSLADFSSALLLRPEHPRLLISRGCLLLSEGRIEDARLDFDASIARDPDNYMAYYHRAQTREALHDPSGLLQDLDQMDRISGDPSKTYEFRGSAHFALKEWAQAASCYRRALETLEGDEALNIMSTLAAVYDNSGDFEDAEALLRQVVQRRPEPSERLRLGIALSQLGRSDDARREFVEVKEALGERAEEVFRANIVPGVLLEEAAVFSDWKSA
ncbi:tetratricopeptide repeat protein [Leifsonia sp. NPDC080035]|uniref:Tetratricopeptide repeat protein n=1 Tax=Leifsonia sp. NPDC080035 TaxID=3143936 RepID=A0AAU7G837_9MICO